MIVSNHLGGLGTDDSPSSLASTSASVAASVSLVARSVGPFAAVNRPSPAVRPGTNMGSSSYSVGQKELLVSNIYRIFLFFKFPMPAVM